MNAVLNAEQCIRQLVERQADAIRRKDTDALMALNAPDMLSFDVVAPLCQRGAELIRQGLESWFAAFDGPLGCELRELEAIADGGTGFCHFLQRFHGTNTSGMRVDLWVRVMLGLRRLGEQWRIAHEHMSDPFDPHSGLALPDLTP